ncbi:LGFP repeat-containing protein [Sphingobacterium hungaricum]
MEKYNNKIAELRDRGFDIGSIIGLGNQNNGGEKAVCDHGILYASPDGLIFEVHGNILIKYQKLGESYSGLGFPRSDEMDDPELAGGKVSYFEYGKIRWSYPDEAQEEIYEHIELDELDPDSMLKEKLQTIANQSMDALRQDVDALKRKIMGSSNEAWCGKTVAYFYRLENTPKTTTLNFNSAHAVSRFGSYGTTDYYDTGHALAGERFENGKEDSEKKEQHVQARSTRKMIKFEDIQRGEGLDIWPGDIVLEDKQRGRRTRSHTDCLQMDS